MKLQKCKRCNKTLPVINSFQLNHICDCEIEIREISDYVSVKKDELIKEILENAKLNYKTMSKCTINFPDGLDVTFNDDGSTFEHVCEHGFTGKIPIVDKDGFTIFINLEKAQKIKFGSNG